MKSNMNKWAIKKWVIVFFLSCVVYHCIAWYFCWDITRFWLRLRSSKETVHAIRALEKNGFYVSTFTPIRIERYELGLDTPRWTCRKQAGDGPEKIDIEEVRKALEVLEPFLFIWRWDKSCGDDEIQVIRNLTKIKILEVHDTSISDASIQMIIRLPNLGHLNIDNTNMTEQSLWEFENHEPRQEILGIDAFHIYLDINDFPRYIRLVDEKNLVIQCRWHQDGIPEGTMVPKSWIEARNSESIVESDNELKRLLVIPEHELPERPPETD